MDRSADIAIVGAGIVGLAHAYMALRKGYRVVMFDRDQFAIGASVRNFGLLWPIGQAPGVGLDRALRSLQHWKEVSSLAGIWMNENGSLHLAYHDDEMSVLEEFDSLYKDAAYNYKIVSPAMIRHLSPVVKQRELKGGLLSITEGTVYSREAVRRLPLWLAEKYNLILRWGHVVKEISVPTVVTSRETWRVNKVFICNGADFETLYPEVFDQHKFVKCKLQMMKAVVPQPFVLGPSLCAGLTLRHYTAFAKCPSLEKVDQRYDSESDEFKRNGVHVLLAQNNYGELIIGDSHHYGRTVEPFDQMHVDEMILQYLNSFTELRDLKIVERWNGVYPKLDGQPTMVLNVSPDITIVNGLGGAGMTLSFGLAEEVIAKL
jgi:D-hydroxyproline dehydrogenase subunit beta